ncbi:MAG: hypothetical protein OXB98_07615 [Bryobacterales bacterium]|nr:hypothetical protein [Bryobacterales bacterium]
MFGLPTALVVNGRASMESRMMETDERFWAQLAAMDRRLSAMAVFTR